ncbi:hypothetical protein GCM10017687_65650 [Streptomyces echinatus]
MMPPDPSQPPPGRPGRKLGPITESAGSIHRAWLEPMREAYFASGRTLQAISFGESAVADECGSDRGEGHEVFGFAFVATV